MPIALIADDEEPLVHTLRAELRATWPELEIGAVAANGDEAAELLAARRFDVAFLDMAMPGRTGLEVARGALALSDPPAVVLVTAYDEHALAAFDAAAIDYLLKPIRRERLAAAVVKLRRRLDAPASAAAAQDAIALALARLGAQLGADLGAPSGTIGGNRAGVALRFVRASAGHGDQQTVRLIPIDEVVYFEAADKYVRVLTRNEETLIRTPLKELVEQLDTGKFWQVHRGTVVNVDEVLAAEPGGFGKLRLRLRSRAERLDVSRAYAHLFRQM